MSKNSHDTTIAPGQTNDADRFRDSIDMLDAAPINFGEGCSDFRLSTNGIYLSGAKFDRLPSASSTSPGFLRFAMILNLVLIDFSVSDLELQYMG